MVQAALGTGCDAIHPGYGFLSERAALAQLCEQHGVIFIGPTAAQIDAVGDKLRGARRGAGRRRAGGAGRRGGIRSSRRRALARQHRCCRCWSRRWAVAAAAA